MLNVKQIFFFPEHDVLLKMKVPVSAICGIAHCMVCVTWIVCVKKDIENEIANILETKGFSTRSRAVHLKHRKKKLHMQKRAYRSKPMLQFSWAPAGFIKQRNGGWISDDTN